MVEQARSVVRRAVMLPGARRDAAVQLLAAKVYREGGDVEKALIALKRAAKAAEGDGVGAKAAELEKEIRADYGQVRVFPASTGRGGGGHLRGRLYLHARRGLIGLTKKRAFAEAQSALTARERPYPATIYLPWGAYLANGVPFDHKRGEETQVTAPFPRIAVLRPPRDAAALDIVQAYVAGIGGRVEVFDSDDRDRVESAAEDLRRKPPAAVFAVGRKAALAARSRLSALPLVHARVPPTTDLGIDPEASPPEPVYGVDRRASPKDFVSRLLAVATGVKRLGLIYDPDRSKKQAAAAEDAAREAGIEPFSAKVRDAGDVSDALEELSNVDAYWVFDDPALLQWSAFGPIARRALEERRPIVCAHYDLARDGALMAVEPDPAAEGAAAAELTRILLWGKKPPASHRVKATGVRWTLNRKIAMMLGLDLPHSAIREAWRVINTTPPVDVTGE